MKVFISYTTPNQDTAQRVYDALKENFKCWIAFHDLFLNHEEQIQQELAEPDTVMVALISKDTFNSDGQFREFRIAEDFRTEVIPVLIEDISLLLKTVRDNIRNRIHDRGAFVSYALHSGQYYRYYCDNDWQTKLSARLEQIQQALVKNDVKSLDGTSRVLAKLSDAKICVDNVTLKEIWTCWNIGNDNRIDIVFDSKPTKILTQGQWSEVVSARGIAQFDGFVATELKRAVQAAKDQNEGGQWRLETINTNSFKISNGIVLYLSSPDTDWRLCCERICANMANVIGELYRPRNPIEELIEGVEDFWSDISEGIGTGLSIAEQLGLFDDEVH